MLRELPAKKWLEWEAFFSLEPWALEPELRADYRTAAICQMIYNSQVTKRQHVKRNIKEFVLAFDSSMQEPPKQKSPNQIADILNLLAQVQANES